jgi:hypothetical protein
MTPANLDWQPMLCCDLDQIVSNIKKGCSGIASVFKEERKIQDSSH